MGGFDSFLTAPPCRREKGKRSFRLSAIPLRSFLPTKRHLELSGAIARPLCPSCTSTIAFAMQLVPWHRKQRRQLEDGSAWSDEHRLRLARRPPFCVRRVAGPSFS